MNTTTHKHIYDSQGRQICCTQEEKINRDANIKNKKKEKEIGKFDHGHDHSSDDDHDHQHESGGLPNNLNVYVSAFLFVVGLVLDQLSINILGKYQREIIYGVSYIAVAYPVFKEAIKAFTEKVFFSEFTLMGLATLGAMAIGEYPEGVAVMLFYSVGEIFQTAAVSRAKASIKSLLDLRSNSASVLRDGAFEDVDPKTIELGEVIQVRSGESVALDGLLESPSAQMNTAALTGESAPRSFKEGERVLAGMINQGSLVQVKVEKLFNDSSISKILDMVQNASAKKAKTELIIRRFAKIYTPIVFLLAVGITVFPYLFIEQYVFSRLVVSGTGVFSNQLPLCPGYIHSPWIFWGNWSSIKKWDFIQRIKLHRCDDESHTCRYGQNRHSYDRSV